MIFYKQLSLIVFLSSFMYAGPMHAGAGRAAAASDSQSLSAATADDIIARAAAGDAPSSESKRMGEGAGNGSATESKDRKEEVDEPKIASSRVSSLQDIVVAQLKELAVKKFNNEAFRNSLKRLPVEVQKQISRSLIESNEGVYSFILDSLKPLLCISPELIIPNAVFGWSPDGGFIAINGGCGLIDIWDVVSRSKVSSFKGKNLNEIYEISYSPNGKYLSVVHYDGVICILDVGSGKIIRTFEKNESSDKNFGYYSSCGWMPNNKHIAITSRDNRINIWDTETGTIIRHILLPRINLRKPRLRFSPARLRFSPDYKYIALCEDNMAYIYNVDNERELTLIYKMIKWDGTGVEWHPICTNYLAVEGGTLNVLTRELKHSLPKCPTSVSYSFDGRFGASRSSNEGVVYIWPFHSMVHSLEFGSTRDIFTIRWAPNNYRIALTEPWDGELSIFNLTEFVKREKEICELTIAEVELLSKMVSNTDNPLTSTDEMEVYWGLPQELRAQYESLQAAKSRKCIVM